nr:hypothetical protein [Tanacetum cinerariifolium]
MEREAQRMNEQNARDAEIARIHAEEELQIMIVGLDRSNETVAKYLQEYHQFATELPIERRIELISDLVRYQDNYAKLVPVEEIYIEALQVKHPIIDWKVHTVGQRNYWKIIRLGGSSSSYQFFVDLLKYLDGEDLNQLWALVKESLNTRPASIEWKLYDSCGVRHVTSKDNEIFMVIEKDYPLRKGLAIVMISYKLQVENYSQMANDLILKIYKIISSPRQQVKKVPTAKEKQCHCCEDCTATKVKQ